MDLKLTLETCKTFRLLLPLEIKKIIIKNMKYNATYPLTSKFEQREFIDLRPCIRFWVMSRYGIVIKKKQCKSK